MFVVLLTFWYCYYGYTCVQVFELDLSTVVPSLSGPKRPHDRVSLSEMKEDFQMCLDNKVSILVLVLLYNITYY